MAKFDGCEMVVLFLAGFALGVGITRILDAKSAERAQVVAESQERPSLDDFLAALSYVESRNQDDAVGDQGKALGRYQIHKVYWQDAVEYSPNLAEGHVYQDVTDPNYAKQVVLAYFHRYGKHYIQTQDWEALARMHNGGPAIMRRQGTKAWENTSKYWQKVKEQLDAN